MESSASRTNIGKTEVFAVDLPGTYSLEPVSSEEQATRDFLVFCRPTVCVYVCAASSLERSLFMLASVAEFCGNIVLCVNMTDELENMGARVDVDELSQAFGITAVCVCAKNKYGISELKRAISQSIECPRTAHKLRYPDAVEDSLSQIQDCLNKLSEDLSSRGTAVRFLCGDGNFLSALCEVYPKYTVRLEEIFKKAVELSAECEQRTGQEMASFSEIITECSIKHAHSVCEKCIVAKKNDGSMPHDKCAFFADKILTGKIFAFPVMFLLLALVFFITIVAANAPSDALSALFSQLEGPLFSVLRACFLPERLCNMLVFGVFRVVGWVVSVMLPAMAIFFPLFTILEDSGYLPRIAFNLDAPFCACGGCGKQALTMCMGFGCNAVGVSGCRIIGSERERLIAILTNAFSPCNGRFPMLIVLITMFCPFSSSALRACVLSGVIVLSSLCALGVSKMLSLTLLSGKPSAFVMEMPPYRTPKFREVVVQSIVTRTAQVLVRAVCIAAPCGLLLWLLANMNFGGASALYHISEFLDPFARIFGMDGVILFAFIMGTPANEIVIPIMLMCYAGAGEISGYDSVESLREIFVGAGWTLRTAVCTLIFAVMHHPCAATLATIYKETKSVKYTLLSALIPAVCGLTLCFAVNAVF